MKIKHLILLVTFSVATTSWSQWTVKSVDNKIDLPYKIAYCPDKSGSVFLKLERVDTSLAFYLTGGYHCDNYPTVEMGLTVKGQTKRYSVTGVKSDNFKTVFFLDDILAEANSEFLADFKSCSSMALRINESYCTPDYHTFNMSGSSKAIEDMSKP